MLDPFMSFQIGLGARHHLVEFRSRIRIEVDRRQVPPVSRIVVGLVAGRHLAIEIAVRLRPQAMQGEMRRFEPRRGLRLAFGLVGLGFAEGRLPA